jgi:centrosomal protein CEP95
MNHGLVFFSQREQQERDYQMRHVKSRLQEKRQSSARTKRYYDEYVIGMRARQMKRRTKEEQIFKKLFEDGIEIQKARLRELKQYAKDKRDEQAKRQQDEVESLENYYRDQFTMLAENIAEEKQQLKIRDEAQAKVITYHDGLYPSCHCVECLGCS